MAATRLPNLIPPFRYAMVEEDLFRGGFPKPRNYRFLQRLRLKTILSLIPDKATPELQAFCEQENIHMLRLTVDRMKEDNIPLSYNKTILALQIIIDPENHPLYIHCLDGADVTGLVIACLRKLQMWTLSSALLEFSRNLHTSVITSEESEFVENFKNFTVTIPMSIRPWLWGGVVNFRKHATLRLNFLNPSMMTDEERELKEKVERRERDREDFYKKRKNDLLDNLFDSQASSSRTHRPGNNNTSTTTTPKLGTSPPPLEKDEFPNVIVTETTESDGAGTPMEGSDKELAATEDNRHDDDDDDDDDDEERRQRRPHDPNNQYLVDVDVDVEGVMMDGLDQVQYYNRTAASSGPHHHHHQHHHDSDQDDLERVDERGAERATIYDDASRYALEPISRTLEALALEGLD